MIEQKKNPPGLSVTCDDGVFRKSPETDTYYSGITIMYISARNITIESRGLTAWLWLFELQARPKAVRDRDFGPAYWGLAWLGSQPEARPGTPIWTTEHYSTLNGPFSLPLLSFSFTFDTYSI